MISAVSLRLLYLIFEHLLGLLRVLDHEEDVEAAQEEVSTWAKSTARMAWACAERNCRQVGRARRGAGSRSGSWSPLGRLLQDHHRRRPYIADDALSIVGDICCNLSLI